MESVTILNAIGQIDDKMIESAVIQVSQRKSSYRMTVFRRVVAIAACLTLVIGLLFAISALQRFGLHGGPDGPVIGIIGTQGSEPTQGDKPTHGTETTQGTEPTHGNDNKDFVTVDSVMMDAMSHYAMSCTIPVEYGTEDGYIPITVSFGLSQYCELDSAYFENFPEILLQAGNYDDETIITLRRMNTEEITQPEYKVEYVWDDDRMWIIGFIFSHTETINLPLTLFSEDSGRIWISITEYSSNGDMGSGAYVVLYYTKSENSISLFAEEPLPELNTNLEFWIAENVDGVDLSKLQEKYGMLSGHEYYGTGYMPTIDEEGQQVEPEHCVIYTVTSCPDYSDKEQYITRIYITDPDVEFYGISLRCSIAEFIKLIQLQGFSVTEMRGDNFVKAQMDNIWITFTAECIMIGVEVTS